MPWHSCSSVIVLWRGRRRRSARPGATAPSPCETCPPRPLHRLDATRHGRCHPRGDGARTDRPLRARTRWLTGRGVPRVGLELPARMGEGQKERPAHRPHRRRVVVGRRLQANAATFEMCAVPHTFCLADSEEGRRAARRSRPGGVAPGHDAPRRPGSQRPSDAEIAEAAGRPGGLRAKTTYDLVIVGAGPAGLSAAVYGASEGLRDARRRRGRNRRTGEVELPHPELPGLLEGHKRQPACGAGLRAGVGLRGKLRVHAPRRPA